MNRRQQLLFSNVALGPLHAYLQADATPADRAETQAFLAKATLFPQPMAPAT